MKNKKFLKAVAAITLSASAALGAFGLAACGGGHTHKYEWENSDPAQHWKVCPDDGEIDESTRGAHDFTNGDCICGAKKPGGTGEEPGGPGGGEEVEDVLSEGLKTFLGDGTGVIYKNGFTKDATVDFVEEAPATGLYGMLSGDYAQNENQTNNLKIGVSGGKLNLTDTGKGAVNAYIKVETVSLKKVHIYAELEPKTEASKWNLMTVLDGNGKAIAYIRADGNKKVGLSLDNNTVYTPSVACSGVISVEISLDLGTGKISGKINGQQVEFVAANGETPAVTQGDITATTFSGINVVTANGSKATDVRNISVDNIGIKTEASEVTPAALKEKLTAQLEAKYAALDVDNKYTTNGEALKTQYETDKAALAAAETNETILTAYNTAVENLDKVESDAAIALRQAKEAACTEIDGYKNASDYTLNAEALANAVTAAKTAINGCKTEEAVATALAAQKAEIDKIKSDAVMLSEKQTAALKELNEYKGGAAHYTEEGTNGNKSAYNAAITHGTNGIEGVNIADQGGAQNALNAVDAVLSSAKTLIDGIKNDATLRAEAKEAAKTELAAYKADEIAGLDETQFPNVVAGINAIKTETPAKIDEAVTLSDIKTVLDNAKSSIDSLIQSTTQSFAEFQQAEKDRLDAYAAQAKQGYDETADATLIAAIDSAVTQGKAAIDAVPEANGKDDVSAEYDKAVEEIEKLKAADRLVKQKSAAKIELTEYADSIKSQISQDQALITALTAYVAEQQGVIDAETTTAANLAEVTQNCKSALDAKVAELKTTKYTVTFNAEGVAAQQITYGGTVTKPSNPANTATQKFVGWYADEACNTPFDFTTVQIYGATTIYAKWQEADVTITYMVNGAKWKDVKAFSGDAATLETGVYVSGKTFLHWCSDAAATTEYTAPDVWAANQTVTLYAKLADKTDADLALNESWTAPAVTDTANGDTAEEVITDNKLFVISSKDSGATYMGTSKAVGSTSYNKGWRSGNVASGATGIPLTVVAKENLEILTLHVGFADSKWNSGRSGKLHVIKNGTEIDLKTVTSTGLNYFKLDISNVNAGDVIEVYLSEPNNGSRLWLFDASAQLAENFTNATVNYYNADHTAVFKTVAWNSLKPVTEPSENPVKEGASLIGWTATPNGTTADYVFDANAKVAANGTLNLYPVYQSAAVTVVFHDKDGAEIKSVGVLEGGTVATADIPADTAVTGFKFLGWYEKTAGEFNTQAFDFTTTLGAGTYDGNALHLYANYKQLQQITVSGDESVTVDAAKNNFYVEGTVTADDIAKAITVASGKEIKEYRLNNGEGDVITLPYDVTANTSIYVVTQEKTTNIQTVGFDDTQVANVTAAQINAGAYDSNGIISLNIGHTSASAQAQQNKINCIKLGGKVGNATNTIKIDLSNYTGKATIKIWAVSGGDGRKMYLATSNNDKGQNIVTVNSVEAAVTPAKGTKELIEVEVDCGKIYYVGTNNTMMLGGLTVTLDVNAKA